MSQAGAIVHIYVCMSICMYAFLEDTSDEPYRCNYTYECTPFYMYVCFLYSASHEPIRSANIHVCHAHVCASLLSVHGAGSCISACTHAYNHTYKLTGRKRLASVQQRFCCNWRKTVNLFWWAASCLRVCMCMYVCLWLCMSVYMCACKNEFFSYLEKKQSASALVTPVGCVHIWKKHMRALCINTCISNSTSIRFEIIRYEYAHAYQTGSGSVHTASRCTRGASFSRLRRFRAHRHSAVYWGDVCQATGDLIIHVHAYMCIYIHTHACCVLGRRMPSNRWFKYARACIYVCVYVYMHVYVCIHMCVCVHMHICVYMYVCVYIYIYIYIRYGGPRRGWFASATHTHIQTFVCIGYGGA
jgi:hypothetical protein